MEFKITKPHLVHKRWELPEGYSIKSFVMREMDGEDELEVGRWQSMISATDGGALKSLSLQVGQALVAVDGREVSHSEPCLLFDTWSSKTRSLVLNAWRELNEVREEDLAVFHAAAKPLNVQAPAAEILDEEEIPA